MGLSPLPDYRYKKDELFKRLKVTTFAQLVIQVASLSDETLEVTNEEIHKLEDGDSAAPDADAEVTAGTNGKGSPDGTPSPVLFINNTGAGESYRSTLQSVISGVGELDIEKDTPKQVDTQTKDMPYPDCPFLLLDVRDRDAYDQCHIIGAYSYPIATLSRTMNPYTNNILEYVSFTYQMWGLAKIIGTVTGTMFNHQNLGVSRRVGGQVLYTGCDYLAWLHCCHQILDSSSSGLSTPLGSSGSCLNLAFLGSLAAGRQSLITWAPVPCCCWSTGLLEGCVDQIPSLPLSTLMRIGFSLEERKRIIS
uniref:Centrosomal protein 41 n=1 Tax=Athene cunicularia TaxID=194338 RepID=A0A663M0X3_ATHCN